MLHAAWLVVSHSWAVTVHTTVTKPKLNRLQTMTGPENHTHGLLGICTVSCSFVRARIFPGRYGLLSAGPGPGHVRRAAVPARSHRIIINKAAVSNPLLQPCSSSEQWPAMARKRRPMRCVARRPNLKVRMPSRAESSSLPVDQSHKAAAPSL